jgi:FixJ family two-component response regulator
MAMSHSRTRIAVVDDDTSVRRALGRLLRASSFETQAFGSGADFFKSFDSFRPQCIILDLHMQSMSGLAVLNQLSESAKEVPVIVITGHDSPRAHSECLEAGARAYLAKPVEEKVLLTTIRNLLGRKALR